MGIFDKFKKKKQPETPEDKVQDTAVVKEGEQKVEMVKGDTGSAYQILVRPIVTEKAAALAVSSKYIFAVSSRANKPEIKKSIQKVYNVHVTDVKILNLPGKGRRYGKTKGQTSEVKKAMVTLKQGEKIPGIIESIG